MAEHFVRPVAPHPFVATPVRPRDQWQDPAAAGTELV